MGDSIYDLCIVGAGMFGSAAARHASAIAGIKVCLIGPDEPTPEEKLTREIFSSYYDEGRIIQVMDEDVSIIVLSKHSINRCRELEKLSDIEFYHPVGFLYINKKDSSHLKRGLQALETLNLPVVDLSSGGIFKRRFPFIKLKEGDYPVLDDMGSGYINPRKMVAAQKKVAKDQGCHILEKVVDEVKPLMDGIHEIVTEGGKIVKAKRILICAGAFTNLKKFPMPKLKMNIIKESVAFLKLPVKEADRLSYMPSMIYFRPEENLGVYILPPIKYPNGNYYLKIGHMDFEGESQRVETLEEIKKWYYCKGDSEKINIMAKFLKDMLPGLICEKGTNMTCVTTDSPSRRPYIDRISPTVTVAAVGNGNGATFSDEVGRIAAILSVTGRWDSELPKSHFSIVSDDA